MNYVVYGEEQYQVKKMINAITKKEVGQCDDMNTTQYDATQVSIDLILEDAETIPFFADKKVIIVNRANFLSASNDTEIDLHRLENYVTHPLDSTVLILSGSFAKMDTRKKIVKKISSLCEVHVCNKLDKNSLPSFVKEELHKRHIEITPSAFRLLCDRLPFDIGVIHHELDKLELYQKQIDEQVVRQLITRSLEEDVFAIVNAVVEKDIQRCFQIWDDLQILNKDPIYLIALIASQFHLLYQVKVQMMKGNTSQDAIVNCLNVHPYRVKLAISVCQRLTTDAILNVLDQLAELDQRIKAGRIDKNLGFEMFLLGVKGK